MATEVAAPFSDGAVEGVAPRFGKIVWLAPVDVAGLGCATRPEELAVDPGRRGEAAVDPTARAGAGAAFEAAPDPAVEAVPLAAALAVEAWLGALGRTRMILGAEEAAPGASLAALAAESAVADCAALVTDESGATLARDIPATIGAAATRQTVPVRAATRHPEARSARGRGNTQL
ncbi:MAG TPA: hypothetical protein VGK93_03400, partial [Candidatus Eisenbacteria bacterium]